MSAGQTGLAERWASMWLQVLFWCADRMPWLTRACRPIAVRGAWATSHELRAAMRANARRLFGPRVTEGESRDYAIGVMSHFYDAVAEIGSSRAIAPDEIKRRTGTIDGQESYRACRAQGRGAILVTAHIGSFETAIGILREIESDIHVVFQRDQFELFERLRSRQRERLGVHEAPVDDGLSTWVKLRDALARDEVVLLQGDRCMQGQQGVQVPFLGGHLRVPTGPARLARLSGAPIIPVFSLKQADGKVRVILTDPIEWEAAPGGKGATDPVTTEITRRIERVVLEHPTQWLTLHPVLVEDQHAQPVS